MKLHGSEIIEYLKENMMNSDEASSTFWTQYHAKLAVDNDELSGLQMLGTAKKRSALNLILYGLLERNLQKSFINLVQNSPSFLKIDRAGKAIAKKVNQIYSLDRLRHTLTLELLHQNAPELVSESSKVAVIGDGFATLTSLLLSTESASQVFLINLNKSLLVDLIFLKKFLGADKFEQNVSLVTTEDDLNAALASDKKVIAIMASDYSLLQKCPVDLAINIASMQEMDVTVVENYFKYLRLIPDPVHFYCCNRLEKILDDGQVLRIKEFPWKESDVLIIDELCPWHQKRYSMKPPFYRDYDGAHWHILAKLQNELVK